MESRIGENVMRTGSTGVRTGVQQVKMTELGFAFHSPFKRDLCGESWNKQYDCHLERFRLTTRAELFSILVERVRPLIDKALATLNSESCAILHYDEARGRFEVAKNGHSRSEEATPRARRGYMSLATALIVEHTSTASDRDAPGVAAPQVDDSAIDGESGAGGCGGGDGGEGDGDGDDDGGGDGDDDPHGVGRGASPIPWLLIALLPLGIISASNASAAPAVHASITPEYPEPSPHPMLDVDIRATLTEFEGLLATFPDLAATKIDQRGTWTQWIIIPRKRDAIPLGYVTAFELQGVTTLRFFELQRHQSSSRDSPCHRLAQCILDALPNRCLLRRDSGIVLDDHGYNLAAVRGLLLAAFEPRDLTSFLYYRPLFRPVIDRFGPGHGFDDMVDNVIDYCERHCLVAELLREVKSHNPGQYQRWAPNLQAVATDD